VKDESKNYTKDIPFLPSTIETVDYSVYDWLFQTMNLSVNTNTGFKPVPIKWVSAERAYIVKKEKETRDSDGTLQYPLISLERASMIKDPTFKGTAWANLPPVNDVKAGSMTIARIINQDKTSNFANADSKRLRRQINFPRKNKKIVYETISIPMPVYMTVMYNINIRTQYQQQMNEIIQPFVTSPGGINFVLLKRDGHHFEGFIQQNFTTNNNVSNMETKERRFETKIELKVLAHLIGGGKNQESPKLVYRQNAVDFKMPRERIIFSDSPEIKNTSGYIGINNAEGIKKE